MATVKMTLRKQTFEDVQNNTDLLDLPVVFTGTRDECKEYAEGQGCEWKDSRRHLFGGYWYHKPDFCLMPDTAN